MKQLKSIKIAVLAIFATATMGAQDLKNVDVPSNIMEKFQKTYTNVKDVEWKVSGGNYKVEFDLNKMEHEIWYDKSGNVVRSEQDIHEKDLPSAIVAVIKNKYSEYKIDDIEMSESNGKITYEVELEKSSSKDLKVVFAADGTILSSRED